MGIKQMYQELRNRCWKNSYGNKIFFRRMLGCNKIQYPGIYMADYHVELRQNTHRHVMIHKLDTLDFSKSYHMET
jgi:hypothetical protein